LDCVVRNLTICYEATRNLDELFGVCKYANMSSEDIWCAARELAESLT